MSFWTESHRQIKQKDRFYVGVGSNILITAKSVSKPTIDFKINSYKMINHEFNYPGTATWSEVNIKLVDLGGGGFEDDYNVANMLTQMVNNTGYAAPHNHFGKFIIGRNFDNNNGEQHNIGFTGGQRELTTAEKSSNIANAFGPGLFGEADFKAASPRKQNVMIWQVSPSGVITECWTLVNPLVKSVKYGDLSYDSSDPVEYELVVKYDWAIHRTDLNGSPFSVSTDNLKDKFKSSYSTEKNEWEKKPTDS